MIDQKKASLFLGKVTINIYVGIFHDKKILQKALICLAACFFQVHRAHLKSENCSIIFLA